jgi:hypothetical protein
MFDLEKTQKLAALFSVPADRRDGTWQKAFYAAVPRASLRALNPQVIEGPDGFSYFALAFPQTGQEFESFCVDHILDFCLEHGFGIVILEPPAREPLWVFRYGDLSSYKNYQRFDGDPADEPGDQQVPDVQPGYPSERMLPRAARNAIRAFLKTQAGIADPAVALFVDSSLRPSRNLVFNLYREQFAQAEDYDRVMHQLLWFLPRSRGLVGAAPSIIEPSQFSVL